MKSKIFTILFFFSTVLAAETKDYVISVLTIGPGSSLSDSFGHSAIRVQDKSKNYDLVFNYGVYDFNDPNFYSNFIKGYLNYSLGVSYYKDFKSSYISNNRSIKEQVLLLPDVLNRKIADRLIFNSKPENKNYRYDYFSNNCSTIIKDIIDESLIDYDYENDYIVENKGKNTYRNLIYENINKNSWGSLGIDICLGSYIDQEIDVKKNTFLPEYLFEYLNSSYYKHPDLSNKIKLVKKNNFINYENKEFQNLNSNNLFYSPLFIFIIISIFLLFLSLRDLNNKAIHLILQSTHIITSAIGFLLLFLWFFTDHFTSAYNYNLLWANPLNIILIFKSINKKWKIALLKLLLLSLALIVLHSITNVQVFNISLYPFFIFLAFRYLQLIKYYSKHDDLQII
ncbi:MAG: DUF4105 domain-containing protein [Flavobacteriaceae bacterium]|jgi:hypothetical protein|nr:DUF4105 domain-containing protein [Flavobacteriaceae bacterium]